MFKTTTDPVLARRAGQIAAGVVLTGGALILAARALGDHRALLDPVGDLGAARLLATTWLGALAAGALVWIAAAGGAMPWLPDVAGDDRLLRAGLVVPTIGVALVLPLTLHLLVALATGALDGFDQWAHLSVLTVAPAHVVFAGLAGLRADRLATGGPAPGVGAIYGLCVLVSGIPFVIPILIVALTGLPIAPLLLAMPGIARAERAHPMLPRAQLLRSAA